MPNQETTKHCQCRPHEICQVCNPEEFRKAVEAIESKPKDHPLVVTKLDHLFTKEDLKASQSPWKGPDRRCCERDTDNDGNCPIHKAPGVLRNAGLVTSLLANERPDRHGDGSDAADYGG